MQDQLVEIAADERGGFIFDDHRRAFDDRAGRELAPHVNAVLERFHQFGIEDSAARRWPSFGATSGRQLRSRRGHRNIGGETPCHHLDAEARPGELDPDGPGGRPVSVFESGAILQYLGRKTGKFYPAGERARVAVEEWLFWQVGGLGPMAGQANHFLNYSAEDLPYPKKRYTDEVHRLFGVMNTRLASAKFLAGAYSIADMACYSWVKSSARFQPLDEFPNLAAWLERLGARKGVRRGMAVGQELRKPIGDQEKKVLFGQRAK